MLRLAADTIKTEIRAIDMVARIGGDEFVILLPEADNEAAHSVIDRIQRDLEEHGRIPDLLVLADRGKQI